MAATNAGESISNEQESAPAKAINRPVVLSTTTIRSPPWTYFHLTFVTPSSIGPQSAKPILDDITVRVNLTAAFNQFLGIAGTAIPVDILKVDGSDTWIRLPTPDASAADAALSGWQGTSGAWRRKGRLRRCMMAGEVDDTPDGGSLPRLAPVPGLGTRIENHFPRLALPSAPGQTVFSYSPDACNVPYPLLGRLSYLAHHEQLECKFDYYVVPLARVPRGWSNIPDGNWAVLMSRVAPYILDSTWDGGYRFTSVVPIIRKPPADGIPKPLGTTVRKILSDSGCLAIFEDIPGKYFLVHELTRKVYCITSPEKIEDWLDGRKVEDFVIVEEMRRPGVQPNLGGSSSAGTANGPYALRYQ